MNHPRNLRQELRELDLTKAGFPIGPITSKYTEPIPPTARSAELANYPTYSPLYNRETMGGHASASALTPLRNELNITGPFPSANLESCLSAGKEAKSLRTVKKWAPRSKAVADENEHRSSHNANMIRKRSSINNFAANIVTDLNTTSRAIEINHLTDSDMVPSPAEEIDYLESDYIISPYGSLESFSGPTVFFTIECSKTSPGEAELFFQGQLIPVDIPPIQDTGRV